MADGLCTGDQQLQHGNVCEQIRQQRVADVADANLALVAVPPFYDDDQSGSDCVALYRLCAKNCNNTPKLISTDSGARAICADSRNNNNIVGGGASGPGTDRDVDITMDINMPASPADDDCRKKRCVDRYDSSESSDSGVAILSCTDCSGSSTASSDITDPGSPFSTASTHSDDSGNSSQPPKMPPTQNVHHPPWPWASEGAALSASESPPPVKRQAAKRKETACLNMNNNNNLPTSNQHAQTTAAASNEPSPKKKPAINATTNSNNNHNPLIHVAAGDALLVEATKQLPRLQQGKITEYFKAQYKSSTILKKELSNIMIKTIANPNSKFVHAINANSKKLGDVIITNSKKAIPRLHRQASTDGKAIKARTIPRKILPAPSKQPDNKIISMSHQISSNFPPIITTLIPNVYTIQQHHQHHQQQAPKATKPDASIYGIPIVTTAIQPLQKVTVNNFVKLNTMSTILKLNNFHHPHPQPHLSNVVPVSSTLSLPDNNNINAHLNHINQVSSAMTSATATCNILMQCNRLSSTSDEERAPIVEEAQCPEELSPADSGISSSLEVLINDEELKRCESVPQKSPILSQPKTIRFPAKERSVAKKLPVSADTAACQWDQCAAQFDTNGALLEHLQVKHVISQATQEQYVCLWQGCKVHGRKSCSRSWLERHVLAHAGSKPFRCIVDGCGQRFNSQLALERHVNGHFNSDSTQNSNAKKSVENPSKLLKRNGKKIRFRRQPWSARMFDFIDSGMMEGLQHRLLMMTEKRTNGKFDSTDGQTLTLSSQVLAKRVELDGTRQLLLRWHPTDIVDDEWIAEKDCTQTKTVEIRGLQPAVKDNLRPILFPCSSNYSTSSSGSSSSCSSTGRQKHRRKPMKTST